MTTPLDSASAPHSPPPRQPERRRSRKRLIGILIASVVGVLAVISIANLAIAGARVGWGPFAFLHSWDRDVAALEERYEPQDNQGGVIFYGASNFSFWSELDDDLEQYRVQNHAFGGSTDEDLQEYADRLLCPYDPAIVVFQTGSNDYVGLSGTDAERTATVMKNKRAMFEELHAQLPDAQFIVMNGLLLPGRPEFTPLIQQLNDELATLAEELDYVTYVDAEALTWDGEDYHRSLFMDDGIHLTHEARLQWAEDYIIPALEDVISAERLHGVRT